MSEANVSAPAVPEEPAPISLWWRICRTVLFVLSLPLLYVAVRLTYEQVLAPIYAPSPAIEVGHDTTRITGPLDADGYVDFVAALDAQAKAGVTPENNAAVPILAAAGCKWIEPQHRQAFFLALGMPVPPEQGDGYTDPYLADPPGGDFQEPKYRRAWQEFDTVTARPWTRDEFPDMARWLDEQEPRAKVFADASRRTGYYAPLVAPAVDGPTFILGAAVRDRARWFMAHAMERIAAGDYDSAWEDVEILHRLAALESQGPLVQDFAFAHAVDGFSWYLRVKIATDVFLPRELRKKFRAREQQLRLTHDIEKFGRSDRLFLLYLCQLEARGSDLHAPTALVDWNEPMRQVNAWIDAGLTAAREPDPVRRKRFLTTRYLDPKYPLSASAHPYHWAWEWLRGESLRTLRGRLVSNPILQGDPILYAVELSEQASGRCDLTDLAFALADYQAEHGTLPQSLEALVPDRVARLPTDPFSEARDTYRYERTPLGYRLTTESKYHQNLKIEFPDPQLAEVLPPPAPGVVP